jgi:hypothetical protein
LGVVVEREAKVAVTLSKDLREAEYKSCGVLMWPGS